MARIAIHLDAARREGSKMSKKIEGSKTEYAKHRRRKGKQMSSRGNRRWAKLQIREVIQKGNR